MKKTKKSLALILAVIMSVIVLLAPQITADADYMTMRDISAFELVSEMNVGINIGNSLDSVGNSETSWGNPRITKELIQAYKQAGFNTIRLPVTWRSHMNDEGVPETAWLDRVQEVVNMILSENMYCIINTHHEQNWLNTNSDGMDIRKIKFRNLWTAISHRFRGYGDHLLFEGYNEILKKEGDWSAASSQDYKNANELSQVFVNTVRETGGNNAYRTLIISTYGAIHKLDGFELPEDTVENRLAVEFHCYYPQSFCFTWGSQTTWGTDNDKNVVEKYCSDFYNGFITQNIPVILGEFGAVNKENYSARAAYAVTVASACRRYGLKAVWWDNGILTGSDKDSFALINRSSYENEFPEIISALVENSVCTEPSDYPTVATDENETDSSSDSSSVITNPSSETSATLPVITTTTTTATTAAPIVLGKIYNLKAKFISADSIKLSWNPVSRADSYYVYKADKNGIMQCYNTVTTPYMIDSSLNRGKSYTYQVVACANTLTNTYYSKFSDEIKVTTFTQKMSKVSKSVGKNYIKLKFSKVSGANGYEIKYSTKQNMKGAKKKTTKKLTYTLNKLTRNKKYYVTVRAYKIINGKKYYTGAKKISVKTKK